MRRRTNRQRGHLTDSARDEERIDAMGRAFMKVVGLYASSSEVAKRRQKLAKEARKTKQTARRKAKWLWLSG